MLTSTDSRHRYFAARLAQRFNVVMALGEAKRNYYTTQNEQSDLVRQHFARLREAEQRWFQLPPTLSPLEVISVADINAPETLERVRQHRIDCVCLFGTTILRTPWLHAFPDRIINLHLGLAPFYRGSATLFWPFVFRELEYLGTTIHLAIERVDAGAILHRVPAKLLPGDDYYAITNRLIRDSIDKFPDIVEDYVAGRILPQAQTGTGGRVFRKADFTEAALAKALAYAGEGLAPDEIKRIEMRRCHFLP